MFPRPIRAVDILLADLVRKMQLSPTSYDLAVARYGTIAEWLDRDGSPLKGLVRRLYPQGSMAMRATISSRLENDEFDIDIMAELEAALIGWGPRLVLDVLFAALNGEPGSRYHGKVRRNTRCVTVSYGDMHLDVTPAVLLGGEPRTSFIFHSKREMPATADRYVTANPWGFARWFGTATSPVAGMELMARDAEAEAVPELHALLNPAREQGPEVVPLDGPVLRLVVPLGAAHQLDIDGAALGGMPVGGHRREDGPRGHEGVHRADVGREPDHVRRPFLGDVRHDRHPVLVLGLHGQQHALGVVVEPVDVDALVVDGAQ